MNKKLNYLAYGEVGQIYVCFSMISRALENTYGLSYGAGLREVKSSGNSSSFMCLPMISRALGTHC